ncbi:hypothetical protein OG257_15630 [Streptomyces sp. NBC_00683]|uniref:hypothetical protein n=1 Tax=Streptomyces sp. NBC_00683 TaxID=2903670 RepID=UPI002E2F59E1|nr:hypothetical protein [Streptomyces sp. NBC_00683]
MEAIEKKMAKQALVGLAVVAVGVFGYVQVFTKGVDRLPERVCSGAVDRNIAAHVLPGTMTAHERGRRVDGAGETFLFSCNVKTRSQDSILSGDGRIHDVSADEWREGVEAAADASKLEVDFQGIRAVSYASEAVIYVPCTPTGKKPEEARQDYGLIVESRTIGDTAVTGDELRQEVTDFAYELLKYSYKIQGCQEVRTLPSRLPRFG